jgi:hypothetical protein
MSPSRGLDKSASVYVCDGSFKIQLKRGEITTEVDEIQNIELTSSLES